MYCKFRNHGIFTSFGALPFNEAHTNVIRLSGYFAVLELHARVEHGSVSFILYTYLVVHWPGFCFNSQNYSFKNLCHNAPKCYYPSILDL